MSKDLHYSIPQFIGERLHRNDKVSGFDMIPDDDFLIYKVNRIYPLEPLYVHLSDAYLYTLHNFYTRPTQLQHSGFILIARPEACYTLETVSAARTAGVAIGKFSALLGALNYKEYWSYNPKERRNLQSDDQCIH